MSNLSTKIKTNPKNNKEVKNKIESPKVNIFIVMFILKMMVKNSVA